MFLDETEVEFQSGKGGSGAVSFHREKHVPRGGPNGADGGRGGDIVLQADRSKRTLYDFRLKRSYRADDGAHGRGNKRGSDGKPVLLKVPVGTVIRNLKTDEVISDLNRHGARCVVCKGGRGGFGNLHYTSSVRQAPNFAEKGEPGEQVVARLELKLLADVGIVGLPNAGKSTFISAISAARPKIAAYPFTTLVPNLGVVSVDGDSFVVADLPGLVEGASQGVGLGHRFLKHAERTAALVHMVECLPLDASDPLANYDLVEAELRNYSPELAGKPRLVFLSKADLMPAEEVRALAQKLEKRSGLPVLVLSAATGEGVSEAIYAMYGAVQAMPGQDDAEVITLAPERNDEAWSAEEVEGGFRIHGKRIERAIAMTDLDNREAVFRLQRRLERWGVFDRLRELGAAEGDTVFVGEEEFAFTEES